jgi:hypothetical protein
VQRYGLLKLRSVSEEHKQVVQAQMEHIKDWSCQPIMLNRDAASFKPVAPTTWDCYEQDIYRILGFSHLVLGVPEPCLFTLLNAGVVMMFVSWALARHMTPQHLSQMLHQVHRVAAWFASSLATPKEAPMVAKHMAWAYQLAKQVGGHLQAPPQQLQQLEEGEEGEHEEGEQQQQQQQHATDEGLWVCLHNLLEHATSLVQQGDWDFDTSMQIMCTLVCCLLFGYLPPLRPSVVISLSRPDYKGPCTWPGCQHKQRCPGNRFFWVAAADQAGSSSSSSSSAQQQQQLLGLDIRHHKGNTRRQQYGEPILAILPPELQHVMQAYLKEGLPRLLAPSTFVVPDGSAFTHPLDSQPYAFVWPHTGKPIKAQQVATIWREQVLSTGVRSPQQARSMFVSQVRTAAAEGTLPQDFSEQAAAHIMGHDLAMWDRVYDKVKNLRASHHTISAMAEYRAAMLQQAAQREGAVQAQEGQ